MRYFTFFGTTVFESSVYFTLAAHPSVDQPHRKGSAASAVVVTVLHSPAPESD